MALLGLFSIWFMSCISDEISAWVVLKVFIFKAQFGMINQIFMCLCLEGFIITYAKLYFCIILLIKVDFFMNMQKLVIHGIWYTLFLNGMPYLLLWFLACLLIMTCVICEEIRLNYLFGCLSHSPVSVCAIWNFSD